MLSHLRVLDLTDEKASFCSRVLADMGARVVKIEKPGGDQSRNVGPFREDSSGSNASLSFFYNNINKFGITLDIEHPEGKSLFLKLAQKTDVIVESFSPGSLEKIGLGFKTLSQINSKLILISVSGFGQSGPRSRQICCDLAASAYGGQMFVCGIPSKPPLKVFGQQAYITASLFASTGILLALRNRSKTGKGEHLDISLQESVVATLEHVMVRYFSEGIIPQRCGCRHWNNAFVVLPCKDGFIHLTLFQQWETLVEWLDSEGMAEDLKHKKWQDKDYRSANVDHLIEVLKRWAKTHTADELFEKGQLMRFPWARVHRPENILNCPQLAVRNFFVETDGSERAIKLKCPGIPYKFSSRPKFQMKSAPVPGEDNEYIYTTELGLVADDIKQLADNHVI